MRGSRRPLVGRRLAARSRGLWRSNIAPIRPMSTSRCTMRRHCAPPASARRRSPCSSGCRSQNPARQDRARRIRPRAGRGRRLQSGARRARPRPFARPARLAHPLRAGRGARSDRPPRRGAALLLDRAQDRSRRADSCCPISACPTRCRRICRTPRRRCAAPRRTGRSIRACGRISRSSSACKAASPKPRQIARADLPPDQAAANVAYLRQMLAHRGNAATRTTARTRRPAPPDPSSRSHPRRTRCRTQTAAAYCSAITRIAAGPRITTNSTGRKNTIIGTVSFGGRPAAFFSASDMRMSRFSCASTRIVVPSGVP